MKDMTDEMRTKDVLMKTIMGLPSTIVGPVTDATNALFFEVLVDLRDVLQAQLELSKETMATRNEIDAALVGRLQDMTDPLLEAVKKKKEKSESLEDIPEITLEGPEATD